MSDLPFNPLFGDLFKMLGQQGPDAWFTTATQLALNVARGEDGDPNPLPLERQRLETWAPLVGRHVDALLGVSGDYGVEAVNRSDLTMAALTEWKPLLEPLATGPDAATPSGLPAEAADMFSMLSKNLRPMFVGFQVGSVAGHFSERAWSLSVLALPRSASTHQLAVNNLATFAAEWSLDVDVVTTFALAREFVATVILTRPGTSDALRALLLDTVAASALAQGQLMERLQGLMGTGDPAAMLADPSALLEGLDVPEASAASTALDAATAALAAYFDAAALSITTALHGPQAQLGEAWRRYRLSDARGEDAMASLFGMTLRGEHHEEARRFVADIAAAHGLEAFDVFLRVDGLPRPDELSDAPRWYQRVTNSPLA